MEKRKNKEWEVEMSTSTTSLMRELMEGKETVKELKRQLENCISRENCEFLLHKIISSNERALSLLNCCLLPLPPMDNHFLLFDSSTPSPPTEGSDPDSKPPPLFKKRKTLFPRSTKQVRVCSTGTGTEGLLGDDYGWRKYGQKDIMGANFPRAYYRCTHRNTKGCSATKHVQRSDEDLSLFLITYKGAHSCSHTTPPPQPSDQTNHDGPSPNNTQDLELKTEEDTVSVNGGGGGGEVGFPSFSPIGSLNVEDPAFDTWFDLRPSTQGRTTTNSPFDDDDDDVDFSFLDEMVLDFDPNLPFDMEFCC